MSPFLKSPMPGTVVSIAVSVGETVRLTFGWSDKPSLPPCSCELVAFLTNRKPFAGDYEDVLWVKERLHSLLNIPVFIHQVHEGQELAVVEAMKMQNSLHAGVSGTVSNTC